MKSLKQLLLLEDTIKEYEAYDKKIIIGIDNDESGAFIDVVVDGNNNGKMYIATKEDINNWKRNHKLKENNMKTKNKELSISRLLNESEFYRIPKNIIGNTFYNASRNLNSMYESLADGNDFHPEQLQQIINALNSILKSSKKFKSSLDVDRKEY